MNRFGKRVQEQVEAGATEPPKSPPKRKRGRLPNPQWHPKDVVNGDLPELDVESELDQIARGLKDADAQRLRTLFYLDRKKTAEVQTPPPVTEAEKIERLSRLMHSVGKATSQLSYRAAFPSAKSLIRDMPEITEDDIDLTGVRMPISLKQLFKLAPEIHGGRGGVPKGFPRDGSQPEIAAWCGSQYIKYLRWKKQEEVRRAVEAEAAEDEDELG